MTMNATEVSEMAVMCAAHQASGDFQAEVVGMAESSARLLNHSGALLERVIKIAAAQNGAAEEFAALLGEMPAPSASRSPARRDALGERGAKAPVGVARGLMHGSARAMLDVHAVIGEPAPVAQLLRHHVPAQRISMNELIGGLEKLARQASSATARWPARRLEIDQLSRGVRQMLTIAQRHRVVARQSADAIHTLHRQAREFVRAMARTE